MHPRSVLFIGNFFFSLFVSLTVYVLFPFLSSYMSGTEAGLVIASGGLLSVAIFPFLPHIVERYGAQQLVRTFVLVEIAALIALIVAPSALTGTLFGVLAMALPPFIAYQLDILLEAVTSEVIAIGRVRTIFLTAWNFGVLSSPLLLGLLLDSTSEYGRVFPVALAALLPFLILISLSKLPSPTLPKTSHMQDTLVCISRDPDLGAVTFAHFLLYLFYIWAPLYIPLYLHTALGLQWGTLGWLFAIMLVPYVLVEYPVGWLADRYLGDKKLMFAGFILAGGALASLSLLTPASPLFLIATILVTSRIGAAILEAMTESHFFRRVSNQDINSISIFRGSWPLANVIGPIVGSLILLFGNYSLLFASIGIFFLVAGVITTLRMKGGRLLYASPQAHSEQTVS